MFTFFTTFLALSIMIKLFSKILFILTLLVGSFTVYCQPSDRSIITFGFKSGVNMSKSFFEPSVSQDIYLRYTGGVVFKFLSEKHAGIQAEVNYSQRGWKEKLKNGNKYERALSYFEMPVLTHLYWGSDNFKVFLNLGPNLSYLYEEKEDYSIVDETAIPKYYYRPVDNDFELALVGGIGLTKLTSSVGDFQLEFRFHYGLHGLFSSNEVSYSKSQNVIYSATLSYFVFRKDFKKKNR
jgi:hypothetical protein